jgi:hypothetical protein
MRIRVTAIPRDFLAHIRPLVDELRNAVNAGDMNGMDAATERLMAATAMEHSIDLSEEEWRRFLAEIRAKNPAFQSDYLLPGEVCSPLFANIASETMVLQLPMGEKDDDDV